jgi:hypothetical protein
MLKLQQSMRLSVKDATQRAIADYPTKHRSDFVLAHPGMVILCVTALYWTQDVTRAFGNNDLAGELARQQVGRCLAIAAAAAAATPPSTDAAAAVM